MAQREEKEMDYLEPFLIQMDVVDVKNVQLTRQQALKLRDDCLANLKQRLIDKANLIQARFEKVCLKWRAACDGYNGSTAVSAVKPR